MENLIGGIRCNKKLDMDQTTSIIGTFQNVVVRSFLSNEFSVQILSTSFLMHILDLLNSIFYVGSFIL